MTFKRPEPLQRKPVFARFIKLIVSFFFVVFIVNYVVVAIYGSRAVSKLNDEGHRASLAVRAAQLRSFISTRRQILSEIARLPSVVAVVQPNGERPRDIADPLNKLMILGAREKLYLTDASGKVLSQNDLPSLGAALKTSTLARKMIRTARNSAIEFQKFGAEPNPVRCLRIAVPVVIGKTTMGALITEIVLARDLSGIFDASIAGNQHAITLTKGKYSFTSSQAQLANTATYIHQLLEYGIVLTYTVDRSAALAAESRTMRDLALALLLSSIVVFALFWFSCKQVILRPYQELSSLQTAIMHAVEGIARYDKKQRMVFCNNAYAKLLGAAPKRLRGQTWPNLIPDETIHPLLERSYRELKETGKSCAEHSLRVDGRSVHRQITYIRADPDNPTIDGSFYSFVTDITDRKNAEILLESQAKNLMRSNAELQRFAYAASHDLKEPLRKIGMACSLLDADYTAKLDGEGRDLIAIAADGAVRMSRLIDDLLAVSRINTTTIKFVNTDLREPLDDAIATLQPKIKEEDVTLTIRELPHLPIVSILIKQVFQNLITNAIRYRGEGAPHIVIEAHETAKNWRIIMTDNGIGIRAKYGERIFEPFQQLDSASTGHGTGIGLALCKGIIERHNGHIWLSTDHEGTGSQFIFELPKQETEEQSLKVA